MSPPPAGGPHPADVRRRAAAHLIVADVTAPVIEEVDEHHVLRVLRIRAGEAVTVTDGQGRWRTCEVGDGGRLEPTGDVAEEPAPPPLTVGFAPTKGDRPEWAVAKLTELGVDRIMPLLTTRSVVRWDASRWRSHRAKWETVIRLAVMQSRQVFLPALTDPMSVADAVASAPAATVLAVPGGPAPAAGTEVVLVGPEGGWSSEEESAAPAVGLGPGVLRGETATVAVATLYVGIRWGIIAPIRAEPNEQPA